MKTTSKIVLGIAMAATAFTSLAGMVHANEHEVMLSYDKLMIDVEGAGEFEGHGVTLQSRGIYDNGLRFDLSATNGDIDGLDDVTFGELDVRYMPGSFGVAGTYAGVDGGEDVFGVGVAAEYMVGGVEAYGTLTSDVDNFLEDFALEIGGRYDVSPNVTLIGEFNDSWVDGEDTAATVEMSARYSLVNNTFVQAGVGTTVGSSDASLDIYSLGLGLNF